MGDRQLHWAKDWQGTRVQVPVPDIQRHYIPEFMTELDWFVVCVKRKAVAPNATRAEQYAMAELQALSYPVIMPVDMQEVRKVHPVTNRTLRGFEFKERLLFPGYLMIGMANSDLNKLHHHMSKVSQCEHVMGFVAQGVNPIRLLRSHVRRMAEALNGGFYDEEKAKGDQVDSLKIGDLVEIMEGPFELRTGQIEKFKYAGKSENRRKSKAFVSLNVFNADVSAEIDIDSLAIVT